MDVLKKIEEKQERYNKITQELSQLQKRADVLVDETKKLQGEFRILVEIGQEQGLIDEAGNVIEKKGKNQK